jgi:hypothetical protein
MAFIFLMADSGANARSLWGVLADQVLASIY